MKTRTHRAFCPQNYLTAYRLDPEQVLYFDIETTGFRASTSSLYMIGWAVRGADGAWVITQMMAQSRAEEVQLLEQFALVLKDYTTLIEFNGDRFDLPYMNAKYEAYGMENPLRSLTTVDLYREIRPFKKALGLDRLNQKSVERFLDIPREDPFSGGELIDVYRSVRDHTCPDPEEALDKLFLHNYEDVLGMLRMTPLLGYSLAICSDGAVHQKAWLHDAPAAVLEAFYELEVPVPKPLHFSFEECCSVTLSGNSVSVVIRPCMGRLYHYFPDYKNYCYLPGEDMAIHKSVAQFVDPSHREKATAQTCYVKKEGLFFPLAGSTKSASIPLFSRYYKDSVSWFEDQNTLTEDQELFSAYIHDIVKAAASK